MTEINHKRLTEAEAADLKATLPKPGRKTRSAVRSAKSAAKSRPARVRVRSDIQQDAEGLKLSLGSDHSDLAGWQAMFTEAYATSSQDFATVEHLGLGRALAERSRALPSDTVMNAALAAVAGIGPQDELEAMMATEMVGAHGLALEFMSRARQTDDHGRLNNYVNMTAKLLKAVAATSDSLGRKRTGGKQQVEVRYVYVDARTQTVVNAPGVGGGQPGICRQPHTPALGHAIADGLPMWGEDPLGDALSVTGDQGEAQVSHARLGQSGRAKGQG